MSFELKNIPSQQGRLAIVTGANVGLGYETALGLLRKDFKLIMACRNKDKAQAAKEKLQQEVPKGEIEILEIDLGSLKSIHAFAEKFNAKYQRLDLLINNAGVMILPYTETEDGFELQMGVNYFGHFLLTGLLLPKLLDTAHSRVVSLSSIAHKKGEIDFDSLQSKKSYSGMKAYAQSKLACLIFGYELQRRLEANGHKHTISVIAHPGVSVTSIGQNLPKVLQVLYPIVAPLFTHSPKKAAQSTLWAALGPTEGGAFFGPKGWQEMKGAPSKVDSSTLSKNKAVAKRLWEASENLTNFKYKF